MEEESPRKAKKTIASWPLVIAILLVVVLLILLGWFFTRGNITTTGDNPEVEKTNFIVCRNNEVFYPYFSYDNSEKKDLEITAIFNGDKLDTVSLVHTLYYSNHEDANRSEVLNHAAFNLETQNAGLGPDIFTAHYSTSNNNLQLTLNAKAKDINDSNAKYLILGELTSGDYTKSILQRNYKNNGFSCEDVNK